MTVPLNQDDCLNKRIYPLSHHLKSSREKTAKTSRLSQQQVNSAAHRCSNNKLRLQAGANKSIQNASMRCRDEHKKSFYCNLQRWRLLFQAQMLHIIRSEMLPHKLIIVHAVHVIDD